MPLPIDTALILEEIIDQVPDKFIDEVIKRVKTKHDVNKGNNKITELRTILQRESQNS